jgi:hypothetical protein
MRWVILRAMKGRVLVPSLFVLAMLFARTRLVDGHGEAALVAGSVAASRNEAAHSALAPETSAAAPTGDPEAVSGWFRQRVMQELERSTPQERRAGSSGSAAAERVDLAYVTDVFEGRVSGIPDERKAGISLQEMDELGDIPYVEQLRKEKRFDELSELGFLNETVPWPACLRTGTCRLDARSSPPE